MALILIDTLQADGFSKLAVLVFALMAVLLWIHDWWEARKHRALVGRLERRLREADTPAGSETESDIEQAIRQRGQRPPAEGSQ